MSKRLAIIGGGPVGLYLAIKLSLKNYSVSLFEKGQWPVDKVCGQGVMPSGVQCLKEIGVELEKNNGFIFNTIEYIDGDCRIKGELAGKAIGIERWRLSQLLVERAKARPNIRLYAKTPVKGIVKGVRSHRLIFENNEEEFDYVFVCDGAYSSFRKKLDFEKKLKGKDRLGARFHLNKRPWSEGVQVYWANSIEAYVTPVGKDKLEIAFIWYASEMEKGAGLFRRLLSYFPELKEKISMREVCHDFKAQGSAKYCANKIYQTRIFFVGDAYKFIDGITGEGISLGIKTARLIANHFLSFGLYHKICIHLMYLNYSFWTSCALWLTKRPQFRRYIFIFLQRYPWIFSCVLRLNDRGLADSNDFILERKEAS